VDDETLNLGAWKAARTTAEEERDSLEAIAGE